MKLAVAITTAPRPRPTLEASISSLRAAGCREALTVFADCDVDGLFDGVTVRCNRPPLGGLRNWAFALECTVHETQCDGVLMLEDDITWARGAWPAVVKDFARIADGKGSTGYLSFYCADKVARHIEQRYRRPLKPGLYVSQLGWKTWGSQALLLPRQAAIDLLVDTRFQDFRSNYVKNRNRDAVVSHCLQSMGRETLFRIPCLVNHELGSANSSLGPKKVQPSLRAGYWTGAP